MYIIKIGHEAPAEAEEAGRSGERAFEFEMMFSYSFEVMKWVHPPSSYSLLLQRTKHPKQGC